MPLLRYFLSALFVLSLLLPARAGIYYVSSLADSGPGSLRQAIADAQGGDTVEINMGGTLLLDTTLVINKNLKIIGGGANLLKISGNGLHRIFWVAPLTRLELRKTTLTRGSAFSDPAVPGGGAIQNLGQLYLYECVLTDNEAVYGGAIENSGNGGNQTETYLENCTLYNNRALSSNTFFLKAGGALYGDSRGGGKAFFTAVNCTISGNKASYSGGAVFLISDPAGGARFTGVNCTITENSANFCGGIDDSQAEAIYLTNTILAGNLSESSKPDLYGYLISQGNNLIGYDASIITFQSQVSDIRNVNPELAPLSLYQSPMPVHPLRCGSPAIDAGNSSLAPPYDLRNQARTGIADIGAFERNPATDLAVTTLTDNNLGSLRQVILLACEEDTIFMSSLQGTILLTESIAITQDLTLIGNTQSALAISSTGGDRLFTISPPAKVDIQWLSLNGGQPELYGGGAILNKSELRLSYCTLSNNRAESGGAIANYGTEDSARLTLINCTLSGNEALYLDGGAIDNRPFQFGARTRLINCTFADNEASLRGGAIYNDEGGIVEIKNTLVAQNQAPEGAEVWGSIQSKGHNLIESNEGFSLLQPQSEILGQAALITPIGYHGGPTYTCRLLPGSPAINAGNNTGAPLLDQRGENRIYNTTIDIGAYEYDPSTSNEEELTHLEPSIYPNPAKEYIHIRSSGLLQEILISGPQGNALLRHVPAPGQSEVVLPLPDLAAGVYFVRINQEQASTWQRLIIQ